MASPSCFVRREISHSEGEYVRRIESVKPLPKGWNRRNCLAAIRAFDAFSQEESGRALRKTAAIPLAGSATSPAMTLNPIIVPIIPPNIRPRADNMGNLNPRVAKVGVRTKVPTAMTAMKKYVRNSSNLGKVWLQD
ncbi:MAG: hypothetical protein O6951_11970 [Actinobacteria bacterium]|nr:hypothetical protein [Actinomycetota bacterium]